MTKGGPTKERKSESGEESGKAEPAVLKRKTGKSQTAKKTAVKPESRLHVAQICKTADKEHPETGGAPSEEGKSALSAGTAAEQHPHFVAPDKAVSPAAC